MRAKFMEIVKHVMHASDVQIFKTNLETVAACSFDPVNKCLTGLITEVCGSCQPHFSVLCLLFPHFNMQITTYGKKITYDF